MFKFDIYTGGKRTSSIKDLTSNEVLTLLREFLRLHNDKHYIITDMGTGYVYLSNLGLEKINNMKESDKRMKNNYLNGLIQSQKEYEENIIDLKELERSLQDKYNNEYIKVKLQEARQYNSDLQVSHISKIDALKNNAIEKLKSGLADELLNSKVNEVIKLFSTEGVKYSDIELQAIYDKYLSNKDALAVRYINEYASKNKRALAGGVLTSIEQKIEVVKSAYDYSVNYKDQAFELSLVQERVFPKFDAVLSE